MSGVITSGNHPKLLWPGLHALFGTTYAKVPKIHTQVFDVRESDKSYEEIQELTGFGLAPVKSEGGSISYDSHTQGYLSRFTNVTYGLGFIETIEAVEDNKYKDRATGRTELLARSMAVTKETVTSNVINRAFSSSYLGGDGKELIATDHPVAGGGTQSNELAVSADLSEASLEDMQILMWTMKDSRGVIPVNASARMLLIPPQLAFEAERVTKSTLQNDTANNAINAIKSMGVVPKIVMWRYLTDTDAWFMPTDVPLGLILFNRRALSFDKDSDFDTDNFKHKATERYVPGWADWRGIVGSQGA